MTGDVSQANYSSLRAAMLGSWALLDDWQQNVFIPHLVRPAVIRRMRRLALETGDQRYLTSASICAAGAALRRPDQRPDRRNHGNSQRAEDAVEVARRTRPRPTSSCRKSRASTTS
jgi:hypothetical protein